MIEDDEYGEDWEDEEFDPGEDDEHVHWLSANEFAPGTKLFTHPPQRKPLTDEEIKSICLDNASTGFVGIVRAVEKAHGIGQEGER